MRGLERLKDPDSSVEQPKKLLGKSTTLRSLSIAKQVTKNSADVNLNMILFVNSFRN
jgi:hypothetical protein